MPVTNMLNGGLPAHCTPTNTFLLKLSTYLGICIPTPLAAVSTLLGCLSVVSWLGAQMPQIFKNYRIKSTAGLSLFFLAEWLLGDATNLTGAVLTHQATWQVVIATYYVIVDVILVFQHFWYSYLRSKYDDGSIHSADSAFDDVNSDMINSLSPINSNFGDDEPAVHKDDQDEQSVLIAPRPMDGPRFSSIRYEKSRNNASEAPSIKNASWSIQPSPRTMMIAAVASNMIAQAAAAPATSASSSSVATVYMMGVTKPTTAEAIGTVISWSSTFLYLGSRLPQIYKNWRRQSTAGLSPLLFFAAFCGNFFYTTSILTNPNAWYNTGPYGNHGWTGPEGSETGPWIANAAPFFLGAFGCLGLDITIGVQFLLYSDGQDKLIKVRDSRGNTHWERVSGWMRGWIPVLAREKVVNMAESQRLLTESRGGLEQRRNQYSEYGGV